MQLRPSIVSTGADVADDGEVDEGPSVAGTAYRLRHDSDVTRPIDLNDSVVWSKGVVRADEFFGKKMAGKMIVAQRTQKRRHSTGTIIIMLNFQ